MAPTNINQNYIKLLKEFVSFQTVSTDTAFKGEMAKAVSWLQGLFKQNGFKVFIFKGRNCNPVIVAKYVVPSIAGKNTKTNTKTKLKTVLVYGHYDVQPAHKSDGWKTDPFVLTKQKDRYVGRGVVDNKGQILAHMTGVFDAIKNKNLSSNVTFIIEGNEESGNADLANIIRKNKKLLACDLVLISDGAVTGKNPTLDVSFRGGGNIRVVYRTSSNDRHSGLFGGSIPNAAFELSCLLSKLKNKSDSLDKNEVSFKSFYDGVLPITAAQKKMNIALSKIEPMKKLADVRALVTEEGIDACSQIGLRPTIEVSGFCSGYTGKGFKNIVPGCAEARLNVRTVHEQNTEYILKEIEAFIRKETPAHVKLTIESELPNDPISLDIDHDIIHSIKGMLREVYQKEVFHKHEGGSIPVVADLSSILKRPMALVSLCNADSNMHGVDENFSLYHMKKALAFVAKYWKGNSS